MKILVTNDDGIQSIGIELLSRFLFSVGHEIIVVAPDRNRSGQSLSLTFDKPIHCRPISFPGASKAFACSGTTIDCVKWGLYKWNAEIEMVISGINIGSNTGRGIFYSSTVGGAIEASFYRMPAIALSAEYMGTPGGINMDNVEYFLTKHLVGYIVQALKEIDNPQNGFLNINIPHAPITGLAKTSIYEGKLIPDSYQKEAQSYTIEEKRAKTEDKSTDIGALAKGLISISKLYPYKLLT